MNTEVVSVSWLLWTLLQGTLSAISLQHTVFVSFGSMLTGGIVGSCF